MNEWILPVSIVIFIWIIAVIVSNTEYLISTWYLDSWDGTDDSARYKNGNLWLGRNRRTGKWFLIYPGKRFHLQFANWKPRFVFNRKKQAAE